MGFAFIINLLFAIIELIGGLYTNSIAIISDAIHDFGDCMALAVSLYLQKYSQKSPDEYYSYGYKRFSLLGALFISVVLLVASIFIISEALERIQNPESVHAQGMFLLAILGVLVNGAAVFKLRGSENLNVKAAYLHMMEDVLGWVAVLVASIVLLFYDIPILDALLSIAISCWVLFNVFRNLKRVFAILLLEIPKNIDTEKLKSKILDLDGVLGINNVRLWSLDGENHIMTLHVLVALETTSAQQTQLKSLIKTICDEVHIHDVTVEIVFIE